MDADMELLESQAMLGDTDAMLELVTLLTQEGRFEDALEWAEKAGDEGDQHGLFRAMVLHGLFMDQAQNNMRWQRLRTHADAVNGIASTLLRQIRDGESDLSGDVVDIIREHYANGGYYFAVANYFIDEADPRVGLIPVESARAPRECLIKQLLFLQLMDSRLDYEQMVDALIDKPYIATKKTVAEQVVYALAAMSAADHHRHRNELDVAIAILDLATSVLDNPRALQAVQEERSHYRKRLFGGWKYVE